MTAASSEIWRLVDHGIVVRVRLTPRAARDAIEGIEATAQGPALRARVRAAPEDGAANAAIERLVAGWLGVPRSCVAVTGGARSRVKSLTVTGDPDTLKSRIFAALRGIAS
jgi:hypothetical protein